MNASEQSATALKETGPILKCTQSIGNAQVLRITSTMIAFKCPMWRWASMLSCRILKLKQLNGIQTFPLLWHVKMSSVKKSSTMCTGRLNNSHDDETLECETQCCKTAPSFSSHVHFRLFILVHFGVPHRLAHGRYVALLSSGGYSW